MPAEACPAAFEREQDPPQVALAVGLLQAALVDFALKQHLAPNLVASNQDIKSLVRAHMEGDARSAATLLTRGWRAEFGLPHLLAVLQGRRGVRIADLRKEAPLAYDDQ